LKPSYEHADLFRAPALAAENADRPTPAVDVEAAAMRKLRHPFMIPPMAGKTR
jgi:hypothetical protein